MAIYTGPSEPKLYKGSTEVTKAYRGQTEIYSLDDFPVTSGLLVRLDASNSTSYPGSGNTWYDLSGNGNDATLYGATYNSGDGHYINFDGVNDRVIYNPTITPAATVITVGKSNRSTWNTWAGLGAERTSGGFILHNNNGNTDWTGYWYGSSASITAASGNTPAPSNIQDWNMYSGTTNGSTSNFWYTNATQTGTSSVNALRTSSHNIQVILGSDDYGGRYNDLRIHCHLLYNRQLSSTEISTIWSYFSDKLP
jgi:hypothetical protein